MDELKRKTIIMVTHDVQEAFELGDRICLMDKGKIVQQGAASELLFQPKNKFVESFLHEQRLSLELKSVKLAELWKWLPSPATGATEGLPAETDVWMAMEQFKFKGSDKLNILHRDNAQTKIAGFDELMSAFYQYKKQKGA